MIEEIWKDIPGYEGFYQASTLGRVRSLEQFISPIGASYKFLKKGRIISHGNDPLGYKTIHLYYNIRKSFKQHKLIAMTFLEFPNDGRKYVIDHINGNKGDNRVENLRYITQSENTRNSKKISAKWRGKIKQTSKDGIVTIWDSQTQAIKELGLSNPGISNCMYGRTKYYFGSIWERYLQ